MIYDVFYKPDKYGNMPFDNARTLPDPSEIIIYAHNVDWDGRYLIPINGEWVKVTENEAVKRGRS